MSVRSLTISGTSGALLFAMLLGATPASNASECSMLIANTNDASVSACNGTSRSVPQADSEAGSAVPAPFPSAGSAVVGSVGFIDGDEVGFFWSVARGDRVSESFNPGLASITRAVLDVEVVRNVLNSGAFVDWDLVINGNVVGGLTVPEGFLGPATVDVTFPPIAGPVYNVTFRVTNEVAPGQGSHTLAYAGAFAHQIDLLGGGGGIGARLTGHTGVIGLCRNSSVSPAVVDIAFLFGPNLQCPNVSAATSSGDSILILTIGTAN